MARSIEKNEQLRQQSKEKIIAAALNQFAKNGLFATRIQDIAGEAGISQGLLYRYYSSKNEIYVDLIEDALDKMNEAVNSVQVMEISGKEKILKSIDALYITIKTSQRYRQTSRLIAEAMGSEAIPKEAKEALKEKRDLPYKVFSQIIQQGQSEGDIVEGDAYGLAVLFWSTLNGLTIYRNTRTEKASLPDKKFIARMFMKLKK
ncbi:TetR/AcrR family transcriptional regulator [Anaerovorax odorimutans]|uniref:TetR/AcrR family transcriptional regulator n=1 Tax=Anaerovorax odorimutans TaxID=109327 RepID=UPI0003FB2A79|nr:TetR/AcrR family transcriptional regulator [Anaerovorax odorimutans]